MTQTDPVSGAGRRRFFLLAGTALACGAAIYLKVGTQSPTTTETISARDAHDAVRAGRVVLIDIREPEEWAETGIPEGAHAIDMRRPDFTEAVKALVRDDPDTQVALICARGVRSARMSERLSSAGLTNIVDVSEGMLGSASGPGWLALNLPTETARAE